MHHPETNSSLKLPARIQAGTIASDKLILIFEQDNEMVGRRPKLQCLLCILCQSLRHGEPQMVTIKIGYFQN